MGTVAQVCFSKAWGGLEMSSVKMTRLFRDAGHISIGICQPQSEIHKAMLDHNLPCLTTPMHDYFSPQASLRLSRWITEHKIEAIYLHLLRDLWIVYPALLRHPEVKLFGFARMFLRNIEKKDFLHRKLYSRLDKLIALSEAQKVELLKCLPLQAESIVVIPNGVDTERFQPRPADTMLLNEWKTPADSKVVGFIGRLDPQKGCLEFVEAAAMVTKQYPSTRFVMVGAETIGDSPFADHVHKRIKELKLEDNIILTSFRRDVEKVLNSIDIFTMPSYEENFANVLLEALASGAPSIATKAGGCPEMLDFGNCGILIEPRSSFALGEAILKLLSDPSSIKNLRQKGRAKALADYSIQRVFQRVEQLSVQK